MGKRRTENGQQTTGRHPRDASEPGGPAQTDKTRRTGRPTSRSKSSWLRANASDLRFLLTFAICMAVYYLATLTPPVKQGFFPAYLRLNAAASAAILRVVGQDVTVRDKSIVSTAGPAIEVERGCDAVEPSALFVSAVLASPVSWLSRLSAAAAGTLVLMVLNLIRVASLFLVKVYYPGAFDTMHLDVWQALFIFMAIVFWAVWASRVSRRRVARPDVSS